MWSALVGTACDLSLERRSGLNVAPTTDHTLSRLTLTTTGDDLKIEQITKHLNKIVDVVKVVDLTEGAHVERDMLLVKVRAEGAQRDEVKRTTDIFRGRGRCPWFA